MVKTAGKKVECVENSGVENSGVENGGGKNNWSSREQMLRSLTRNLGFARSLFTTFPGLGRYIVEKGKTRKTGKRRRGKRRQKIKIKFAGAPAQSGKNMWL